MRDDLAKETLLSRVLGKGIHHRSLGNFIKILSFVEVKKEATPMQVMKNTSLSSSIVYPFIEKLRPAFLKEIGRKKSSRGPSPEVPIYQLTPHGIILLGYLLRKKNLVLKGIESFMGNPFYRIALAALEKAPRDLIFSSVYRWLQLKDASVELLFHYFIEDANASLKPEENIEIRMMLQDVYSTLAPWEQEIILDYFRGKMKEGYLRLLRGKKLKQYYEYAEANPEYIIYLCKKCGGLMQTKNPFETRTICSNCLRSK